MGELPFSLADTLLTEFHIASNPGDPTLKKLILICQRGEARFVLARQQLLALANDMVAGLHARLTILTGKNLSTNWRDFCV